MPYSPSRPLRSKPSLALLENLESRVLLSVIPNDPRFSSQYYLNKIDAPDAWSTTTGSNTVVIAVLDTGIDLNSADLAPNIWTNPNPSDNASFPNDVHGWNFVDNNNDVSDNFVHGTSVSAVIGAVGNNNTGIAGIGWNIKILPVVIGTSNGADAATVTQGINYIIGLKKEGVNIVAINASYISFGAPSLDEVNAISNAGKAGMLYVAAAGNSSLDLDNFYPSSFIPSNMIMVAATDENDNLWDQSSYGAKTVAVGAPGVDIETTIPGDINISLSGTSYAAPMVSGIAALLKSADPSATVAQLKSAILNSGDVDPSLAGKTITGRRVNANSALTYLLNNQTPTPPVTANTPPTGVLESITATAITGHAQDLDAPTKSISVQLFVDGKLFKTYPANVNRPDLTATLGSPKHGFSIPLAKLPAGIHQVSVYAVDATSKSTTVLLGSATIDTNAPPTGLVETLNSAAIIGYAFDANSGAKAIQVRYTIDGGAPVFVSAKNSRPDLAGTLGSTAHGFSIALPQLPAGNHTISVDAVDPLNDQLVNLANQTITVAANAVPQPTGTVTTLTTTQVAGTITDPGAVGPVSARVDIDGKAGKPFVTTAGADAGTYTFSAPLKLKAGAHRIDVYAIDLATGAPVLIARQLAGYAAPTGSVTSVTAAGVSGTASSPNGKGGKSLLRIDIDGLPGALVSVSSPFGLTLPPLPAGSHQVVVSLIDPVTLTPTVLADQTLTFA